MGLIGVKVWIYKGEVLTAVKRDARVADERNSRVRENFQPRRPRGDRGGRDGDDRQFAPREQGDRPPRDNNFRNNNRPPRADGQQQGGGRDNRSGGGFNRNRGDRTPPAPPVNFGNRKMGAPRSQPRPKPEETAETVNVNAEAVNNAAEQAEGGNVDVNT
jgi:hypothetical protein